MAVWQLVTGLCYHVLKPMFERPDTHVLEEYSFVRYISNYILSTFYPLYLYYCYMYYTNT